MKGFFSPNIAGGALIFVFCLQGLLAAPLLSSTSDEPIHLAAGFSYWQTRDFRLNPEHPPLAKLLASLPLLAIRPNFDKSDPYWQKGVQDGVAFNFLYGNDAGRLLFWARAPLIALAALGGLATFLWARDLFGPSAGVVAAFLYAFCPNLLAHGMLVTTDVPLAAFTVMTLYLFWKRGDHPSWKSDLVTGLFLGAAMTSKFSGAFLPLLLAGFCVARKQMKSLLVMAGASLLVIEAAYLFSSSPLLYFQNARFVNANHIQNYPFYFSGVLKPGGWWYYFVAAFALKATVPTLCLIVFAIVRLAKGFADRWGELILLAGIGSYVVLISVAADQIGVRYLLPVFPLVFVWVSRVVSGLATTRAGISIVAALLAWHAWSGIHAFPNYIPYFNEFAGGAAGGPVFLDDSNVDWGQSVKQAAEYVRRHHLENVNIYTFSPLDNPQYYGLPPNIPRTEAFQRLVANRPAPGVYIISAHYVARMRAVSPAWKSYKPDDRIGDSLLVYRF
jgi:hypothetical protein